MAFRGFLGLIDRFGRHESCYRGNVAQTSGEFAVCLLAVMYSLLMRPQVSYVVGRIAIYFH